MLSSDARRDVDELLSAVGDRPCELPLRQIVGLAQRGLKIEVDRNGAAPVVYTSPSPDLAFEQLSPREREVVTLLAAGFSNDQIASTLFVSLATVKGHIHSVFAKTGFTSRTQVVAAWYGGLSSSDRQP